MTRLLSDSLSDLLPYVPGEQPREPVDLKLNTNENPYGPSPRALEAIRAAASDDLRLYPDPSALTLREAIAQLHGLHADQVFVGNGSDEVLAHIYKALFQRHGVVLAPDISYSFYGTYAAMFGVTPRSIPLADDFSIRPSDYISVTDPVAGIIFANPNAPTGLALDLESIASIAAAHPDAAVVVDEAYVDFGAESAVALLKQHDNIVVVHTLSKSRALAGLRVGFAMASQHIVAALNRVKDSFNSYPLDRLALAGATASIQDIPHFEQCRQAIMQAREQLSRDLAGLGFHVLPSSANFIFARHPQHDAQTLSQGLRAEGILVRHFDRSRIRDYLRITVGTSADCRRLCQTMKTLVSR